MAEDQGDEPGRAGGGSEAGAATRARPGAGGGRPNELPQLLNGLIGEMSPVGPRPEEPYYVALKFPRCR